MTNSRVVYRFLHTLLLFIYALVHRIYSEILSCKCVLLKFSTFGLFGNQTGSPHLQKLSRIPDNISLVLLENYISIPTLCKLLVICTTLGIKEVSVVTKFISQKRVYKLALSHLMNLRLKCIKESTSNMFPCITISYNGNSTIIHFLDANSGPTIVSEAARHLSSKMEPITATCLDTDICAISNIPLVPLTVIFGASFLDGLLPWQSGSTEILTWPSHICISDSNFVDLLQQYSTISQRWGT